MLGALYEWNRALGFEVWFFLCHFVGDLTKSLHHIFSSSSYFYRENLDRPQQYVSHSNHRNQKQITEEKGQKNVTGLYILLQMDNVGEVG